MVMLLIFLILIYGIKRKETLEYLDVEQSNNLRGIACIYILLCHCNMFYSFDGLLGLILKPYNEATILSNGLFFFISGYGLWKSSKWKINYLSSKRLFFRIKQLIIPAISVYMFSSVILVLKERGTLISIFSILHITRWLRYNDVIWFVIELIFLYILFWILFSKLQIKYANAILLICIILWECIAYSSGRGIVWYASTLCFACGLFVGQLENEKVSFSVVRSVIYGVGLILSFSCYVLSTNHLFVAVLSNISSLNFVLLIYEVTKYVRVGNSITSFLAGIFYEIYLIHMIVIKQLVDWHMIDTYKIFLVFIISVLCGVVLKYSTRVMKDEKKSKRFISM